MDLYLQEKSNIIDISDYYPQLGSMSRIEIEELEEDPNQLRIVNQIIKDNPIKNYVNSIKRGDVVLLTKNGIRNDGKFMWDGEKLVHLDYSLDEYGSVPAEFSFPEFRPSYFVNSISHNNIIRLSPDKNAELKTNFNPITKSSYITDKYHRYPVLFKVVNEEDINVNEIINYPDIILSMDEDQIILSYYQIDNKLFINLQPINNRSVFLGPLN